MSKKEYEIQDAKARPVVFFLVGLFLLTAGTFWLMDVFFGVLKNQSDTADQPSFFQTIDDTQPPEIQLEVHPSKNYEALKKEWNEHLSTFGWVDEEKKIVHLPIHYAMNDYLKKRASSKS